MDQIIVRMAQHSDEAEIYIEEKDGLVLEKVVSNENVLSVLKELGFKPKAKSVNVDIMQMYSKNIIYYKDYGLFQVYYVNFTERRVKCTHHDKGYNTNHPNTIFKLTVKDDKVTTVFAWAYKEFNGLNTELYCYPSANMLGVTSLCLGTVNKTFDDPITAIMNGLEANYTADRVSNINFKSTTEYFTYISENSFPYQKLKHFGKILDDVVSKEDGIYDV